MALRLFNTLTRSLQDFVPLDPQGKRVGMYCCGPTVYDFGHIGNFRTFVLADLVRRYLEFRGFQVLHVMNITDVEDKIIRRVRESGMTLREYTQRFEQAFFEDHRHLNCLPPHQTPRATEHIAEIIALIEKLVARGIGYVAPDGSVYFSIDKYRDVGCQYGQLLRLNLEQMRVGDRVSRDEYEKESVADFALWKARVPEDGAVCWPSPWGEGRPGWHIECSAMSAKWLGPSFDLHLGGEDLIFPHHEDEIAQTEGAGLPAPGQRFVRHWVHGAHLLAEGRKMSKSLGNFYTLRDLLARGFSGREIRYLLLTAHYRESFNFTLEGLTGARSALARLDECLLKLRELAGSTRADSPGGSALGRRFVEAMDSDLNISAAWGAVFDWVRETNRRVANQSLQPGQAAEALAVWSQVDSVFGIGNRLEPTLASTAVLGSNPTAQAADTSGASATPTVPEAIAALLEQRQAARRAKDFQRADQIRDELKSQGWVIEDTPKGPRLKRA